MKMTLNSTTFALTISCNKQLADILFSWAKILNSNQIQFAMHPVYAISVLLSQQYKFGVRKC